MTVDSTGRGPEVHVVRFDARGVYLYHLVAGSYRATNQMTLVR